MYTTELRFLPRYMLEIQGNRKFCPFKMKRFKELRSRIRSSDYNHNYKNAYQLEADILLSFLQGWYE